MQILKRSFLTLVTILIFSVNCSFAHDWTKIMNAIIQVESKGKANLVSKDCVGILQIRPCLVKACNQILKSKGSSKRYTLADRYNVEKSKEMFVLIQNQYNKSGDAKTACRVWNGGNPKAKLSSHYWREFSKYYFK